MGAGGHYKVLNRPKNQRYGCYGASRVPYAPRKYAESTGNGILWTSYTADFFQLLLSLEIGQFENLSSISPEIPV